MRDCCSGSVKPGVSRTVSAAADTVTPSSVDATQTAPARRTHSVQERHGQTVYVPSTDPLCADISPSSATVKPGATTARPTTADPSERPGRAGQSVTAGAMTVSAPPGVEVRHDSESRTFTLTFGVGDDDAADTTADTKVSAAQLIWQPPPQQQQQRPPQGAELAPADDVTDAPAARETSAAAKPSLSRILSESTDEPPDTPTSPDGRKSQYYEFSLSFLFCL